jgi:hypothetical protein
MSSIKAEFLANGLPPLSGKPLLRLDKERDKGKSSKEVERLSVTYQERF